MKPFALAGVAVVAFGSSAVFAADMPVKARPAPVTAVYNWTGLYAGLNGGYGWANSNDAVYTNNVGVSVTGAGPGGAKGGFGGGQLGYNWQTGRFVFGVEADFQGAGLRNSTALQVVDIVGDTLTTSQKLDWFYTVRGRAGYAFDRVLVYVTGGFAGGHVQDQAVIVSGIGPSSVTLTDSTSRTGYVLGGGLEYAFAGPWSAKLEYQYLDLGQQTLFGAVVPANGTTITSSSIKDRFNTIRLGVNYRFGG